MPINCTVRDVVKAHPALEQLSHRDLPQSAAWRMGIMIDLMEAVSRRYSKQANELIKKHGEPNKDGVHEVGIGSAKREEWEKEHDELLDQKAEIGADQIPLSLFKRKEKKKDKDGKDTGETEIVDIDMNGLLLSRCIMFFKDDSGK